MTGYVQIREAVTGVVKKIANTVVSISGVDHYRQEVVVAGTTENAVAAPTNAAPASDAYGLPVRQVGVIAATVTGTVDTGLTQPTTPADTQPVSIAGTIAADITDRMARVLGVVTAPTLGQETTLAAVLARLLATLDVVGTVTANQGTSPWVVSMAGAALDTTLQAIRDRLPAALVGGRLSVDVGSSVALTDAQLRDSPVPVSGTVSTGGLTDAELRASPVPVSLSGVATDATLAQVRDRLPSALEGGRLAVETELTQPLTDAQLRNSAVPISAASLPLPTSAARQVDIEAVRDRLPSALVGGRLSVDGSGVTQPVAIVDAPSAAIVRQAASATSVQIFAARAGRRGMKLRNEGSAGNIYVLFGTTATTTNYTVRLSPGAFYELPPFDYSGRVDAIWDSTVGAGSLQATETY